MELVQYRTDGHVDRTPLELRDVQAAKFTALSLVAHPAASGVYRIKFVDAEYDRDCFDTYHLPPRPEVGAVVFAGAS